MVKEVHRDFGSIDISNLEPGLYFFKLRGDNVNKTVRIIKQ